MIDSPCTKVCSLIPGTNLCSGCYRTLPEIANWLLVEDAIRLSILDSARDRRSRSSAERRAPSAETGG